MSLTIGKKWLFGVEMARMVTLAGLRISFRRPQHCHDNGIHPISITYAQPRLF